MTAAAARELLDNARRQLARAFDATHGGFGSAPKFPHSMDLQLLLRLWRRDPRPETLHMVTHTLDKMAAGGIYDHLAGGFARYSVDERWLVPHFEKMLYDNALLTSAYNDLALAAGSRDQWSRLSVRIVLETCNYILGYMTDSAGGFHSTEDADSEGEEGKFYVWTPAEIKQILGNEPGERFCYVYDVSNHGNFEHGQSILNLPKTIEQCANVRGWELTELRSELDESRRTLLKTRDQRIRPGKDDKVIVAWNGLAGFYHHHPIKVAAGSPVRLYLVNMLEFDQINNLHLHGNLYNLYRSGTSMEPDELTDMVTMSQGERGILEFSYKYPGQYMFHAHKTEFAEKGWMGMFSVKDGSDSTAPESLPHYSGGSG